MFVFAQAEATWQWYNYYHSMLKSGATALRINLDETAVCLFQGGVAGTVFISKTDPAARQDVSLRQRRTYMTHVALACEFVPKVKDVASPPSMMPVGNEFPFHFDSFGSSWKKGG